MHKWQILTSIFVLLFVCDEVAAGDKEDVLAAVDAIKAAWTSGDVDAAQKLIHDDYDGFDSGGSLLAPVDWDGTRAAFAAGLKFSIQSHHSNVSVYGDTAILTEYQARQTTPPGGTPLSSTLRATIVLVKQKGQWKAAHWHASLLFPDHSK
jgi:ketosteroid isomerase-like protein